MTNAWPLEILEHNLQSKKGKPEHNVNNYLHGHIFSLFDLHQITNSKWLRNIVNITWITTE